MKALAIVLSISLLFLWSCETKQQRSEYKIIPEPQELVLTDGTIKLSDTSGLIQVQIIEGHVSGGSEGYELILDRDEIRIIGNSAAGVFYGRKTLEQILPPGWEEGKEMEIPCVSIKDWPAFSYRGGMLDVSRHFFPKSFILNYIDILAFHKLNYFHWHLTDGTAWRLEIDAFPELTASVDSYSKEDVREIIAYATKNHITIIPEIEMPGHSDAALSIYPEYTCDPDVKSGVYCAGKEETFEFLETVLLEVIELFPSKIIHIGGDEVGKGQWKECADCQARMKKEGLKDEDELQSYFVKRIANFLNVNGRDLIGWDEILEGGLPETAKVMSWRGMAGGIEASTMGHDVVMSPGYPCYFDHYQSNHADEPQAWGGLNGIKDVYGFNPIPSDIPKEKKHHILGGQANLWTEQIATPEHAEYMMMPRYSALSEALWSGPEKSNWEYFEQKMIMQMFRYEALGYNYAHSAFTPVIETDYRPLKGALAVKIKTELELYPLHLTLDGSIPNASSPVYDGEFILHEGEELRALTLREGKPFGFVAELNDLPNKTTGKEVKYNTMWEDSYDGIKEKTLVDGKIATKRGDHPHWQGFKKKNLDIVVDLGKEESISRVWARFFQHAGMTRVMFPTNIQVFGSQDGENFSLLAETNLELNTALEAMIEKFSLEFAPNSVRYIQIVATNPMTLFDGHPREGMEAWVFVDEIGVE